MYTGRIGVVEPDELGDIHSGDLQQGQGVSTSQLGNVNVPLTESHARARAAMNGNLWTQSPLVWAIVVVLLILVKIVSEKAGERGEFSTVRIGLENWFVVGALATTFFFAFKLSVGLIPSDAGWAQALRQYAGII